MSLTYNHWTYNTIFDVNLKKNSQYKKYKFDNANKLYFIVPETENNKDIITNYPLSINLLDEVLSMLCRKE